MSIGVGYISQPDQCDHPDHYQYILLHLYSTWSMFHYIFLYVLIYVTYYKPILAGVDLHDNMYWLYIYVTLINKYYIYIDL